MKKHLSLASISLVMLSGATTLAHAQTTLSPHVAAAIASQAIPPAPTSALAVQEESSGAAYISGGAGAQERGAMEAKRSQFPFKLVLSAAKGEYIVAEKVRLIDARGKTVVDASEVGPWLMIKAPIGSYKLEVSYLGQTQTRKLKLGGKPSQVNLRFAKAG